VAADVPLIALRDDGRRRVPNPPALDAVVEDAGRQRLASYYLYSAQIAGLIGHDDLAPARWEPKLAEPMQQKGLTRLAPKTDRGLDAQLTPAEQATRRSSGRQAQFAELLVGLINHGAFGPLCGDADSVRLAAPGDEREPGADLELIKDQQVIGTCKVQDHWELVAQHLAGAPLLAEEASAGSVQATESKLARELKESGISHAVSLGTTLAVSIHPLGAAAGLGTRLVRTRIQTATDQADTLRHLSQDLRTVRDEAHGELNDLLGPPHPTS
jgi:hypothetical protein